MSLVFFISFQEENIKVVDPDVSSFEALLQLFQSKFPDTASISIDAASFYVTDRDYGILCKLENLEDIVPGTLLTLKVDKKKRLEETAAKRAKLDEAAITPGPGKPIRPPGHLVTCDADLMIRLRGLPYQCKEHHIREFMGEIQIQSVLIAENMARKPTGEAFVQLVNAEDVDKALALDKQTIGKRYIEVYPVTMAERNRAARWSLPWAASGMSETTSGPYRPDSSVALIRGIAYSATERQLLDFFYPVPALGVHLLIDHQGRPSGDGFVEFPNEETLNQGIINCHRKELMGRYIEVFRSSMGELNAIMGGLGGGGGGAAAIQGRGPIGGVDPHSQIVRLRGLPYSANDGDIRAFFKDIHVRAVHFIKDQTGRPSGEAFAEFIDDASAIAAMGFHKERIGSRYIELYRTSVGELLDKLERRNGAFSGGPGPGGHHGNMGGGGYPNRGGGGGGYDGGYHQQGHMGGPPTGGAYSQSALAMGPLGMNGGGYGQQNTYDQGYGGGQQQGPPACVQMRGLPYSAVEADITTFFQRAGVTPIRIHCKTGGGEAFVEFATGYDAQNAISLNKQHMGHRYVELKTVDYNHMAQTVGLPPLGYGGGPQRF